MSAEGKWSLHWLENDGDGLCIKNKTLMATLGWNARLDGPRNSYKAMKRYVDDVSKFNPQPIKGWIIKYTPSEP